MVEGKKKPTEFETQYDQLHTSTPSFKVILSKFGKLTNYYEQNMHRLDFYENIQERYAFLIKGELCDVFFHYKDTYDQLNIFDQLDHSDFVNLLPVASGDENKDQIGMLDFELELRVDYSVLDLNDLILKVFVPKLKELRKRELEENKGYSILLMIYAPTKPKKQWKRFGKYEATFGKGGGPR